MVNKESVSLSLIIPCLNEAENISLVIERLNEIIAAITYPIEIIIVDGGSDDETPNILKREFQSLDKDKFKLILMEQRKGYGNDILEGLKQAKHDTLAWTHADLQTDLKDVIIGFDLYNTIDKKRLIVKGQRKRRKLMEVIFTTGMQIVSLFILRINLSDINAQPKIFPREFFKSYLQEEAPTDFSLDLYLMYMARMNNYEIVTFPVLFKRRQLGEAKGGGGSWKNRVNLTKRTFTYILKLKRDLIDENKN